MTGHIDLRSCVILNMYVEVVSHLKLERFVYRQLDHIINLHVPEGECVWLCTRCQSILGKGKVPPYACINNIQVVKVPPVLSVLNTMEQRLISKVQAFMRLIVLPLGERALAGQRINFPVDVSQVCNALPRPIDESGVILVQSSSSTSASTSTADGGKVHHLLYHHHLLLPLIPAKGMWLESLK